MSFFFNRLIEDNLDYTAIIDGVNNVSCFGKKAICRYVLLDLDACELLRYYKNQLFQKKKGATSPFLHLMIDISYTKEQLIHNFCL